MKHKTLKEVTDQELIDEVNNRLTNKAESRVDYDPNQLELADMEPNAAASLVYRRITPYQIMEQMINQGWSERPEKGYSDPRINRIWDYVGFPSLTDDDSYCAATLNACLKLAGYEMSEKVPSSRSFDTYGKNIIIIDEAEKGDIIIFHNKNSSWAGHVGFFKEYLSDGRIKVSGANQRDKMCDAIFNKVGTNLMLSSIRRITEMNRISEPDWETLSEWGLIGSPLI